MHVGHISAYWYVTRICAGATSACSPAVVWDDEASDIIAEKVSLIMQNSFSTDRLYAGMTGQDQKKHTSVSCIGKSVTRLLTAKR